MILRRLALADFRSYASLAWEPASGLNLVVGENGTGKTNLLEAIALCAGMRLRSLPRDVDMIRRGAVALRIVAVLGPDLAQTGGVREIAVALMGRSRRYLLDGSPVRSGTDGTPAVVAFTPDDLDIVKGGPDVRRQLLERDLGQLSIAYRDLMRRYGRALTQRNALLRAIAQDEARIEELYPWDEAVAQTGSAVQRWRREAIEALQPFVHDAYRKVSGGRGEMRFSYRPRLSLDASEAAGEEPGEGRLLGSLRSSRRAELARGYTLVGPHRDDLGFELDGRDMRGYASQGEHRTAVVCVKMGLLERLWEVRRDRPILVLDDVLSELDAMRQDRLLEAAKGYQTFVSSTVPTPGLEAHIVQTGGGRLRAWQEGEPREGLDPNP